MSTKFNGLSLIAAAALVTVSAAASAASGSSDASFNTESDTTPSSGAMAVDLLLLRPLSFVGTVLGTVVFVAGLPFEALGGDVSGPAKRLVVQPAKFTFVRPLGDTEESH